MTITPFGIWPLFVIRELITKNLVIMEILVRFETEAGGVTNVQSKMVPGE